MRIIAGAAGGRTLLTRKGQNTRPTADRVKEAMFSVLLGRLPQATVLDAFAGSAALGLEAMSRGADAVWFIEQDRAALDICRRNLELCGFAQCHLLPGDCLKVLPRLHKQQPELRFDLIFADPPYNRGLLNPLLQLVADLQLLAPEGVLVAETTARNSEFLPDQRWQVIKSSSYGDTAVHYCQLKPESESESQTGA